jgi:hypothetical protein
MAIYNNCIGFQRYEIYADPECTQVVGLVDREKFYPGMSIDELSSDEIIELAVFMEDSIKQRLH